MVVLHVVQLNTIIPYTANSDPYLRLLPSTNVSHLRPVPAAVHLRTPFLSPSHACHMSTDIWRPGNSSGSHGSALGGKGGGIRDGHGRLVCPKCGEPFKAVASIMSKWGLP